MASNNKHNYIDSKFGTKEKAAEMLANPEITTDTEIIDSIDVSRATFYKWKNQQDFIDMVNNKVDKYTDKALPKVWESLIDEATSGSVRAQKLYFEMKNKYRDRKEITGKDGQPIKTEQSFDLSNLTDEELKLLEKINKKIEGS